MSTSLASAKKRRANITEPQPQFRPGQQQQQMQPQPGGGLTLQQVIKLVDTRLTTLEKIVSDQKTGGEEGEESGDWIDEFNKRTEIIAVEIDSIKTTVLQLQAFTMEVNKKMFEKIEALTSVPPVSVAREVPAVPVAQVSVVPSVSEPTVSVLPSVSEPQVSVLPSVSSVSVSEPVVVPAEKPTVSTTDAPAITLELAPAPIEPSNVPILSRFENKSKKNNNNTST